MVLAAGLGLRMRPLSLVRAKAALPVLNRPLVHWTLELLARAGVTDVVINLHHLPATIVGAVGDGRAFGMRVVYSRERRILGTGGGPRKVRSFFGDGPCLLVNGDVVFDFDLEGLVAQHRASGARATLALKPNPGPRRYGSVVTDSRGWVRALVGLPRPARGRVSLFAGVHVLDPELLDLLPSGPSDTVRDLYPRVIAEGGRVLGVRVRGPWYDLGSPAKYLASHRAMLASGFRHIRPRRALVDPDARVGRGARVLGSVLGPGAMVEEEATVVGSVLWEAAQVGRGATVRNAILAEGARVPAGSRVEGLVGVGRSWREVR